MSEKTRGNVTSADRLRSEDHATPGRLRSNEAGAKNLERWRHENPRNLRHGVFAALLGAEPEDLRGKLDEFENTLVRDLGGHGAITAAKQALIVSSRLSFSIILLGQALIERSHISEKRRKSFASVLEVLVSNQNSLRRDLTALGLERSEAAQPSLQDAIDEFNKEKADAQRSHDH